WWLLSGKKYAYYCFAIIPPFIVALCLGKVEEKNIPQLARVLIIAPAFGLSYYAARRGLKIAESLPKLSPQNVGESPDRVINIGSGIYNESLNVQGDYVQGDKYNIFNNFDFNRDSASAVGEIEKLLRLLEKKVGSAKIAQQKTIQDLSQLVRHNAETRKVLYSWLKSLGITSPSDEIDAAEKMIAAVCGSQHKPSNQSIFHLDKRYQRLEYLLKTAQWQEADDETVRVIAKLMPGRSSKHGCTSIEFDQITPRALKTINRLWLEASGGRFGFSVQKQIWQRIRAYQHHKPDFQRSEYDIFVETVGWSNKAGRVYHVDFDYLITNPKGHLPVKILLWETYSPGSNYCHLSNCLFDEFMEHEYSNVSFLPEWLRRWFLQISDRQ
ncbi:MAG: GUN4 domain-containing protein, partial [Phormidesmis sp. CAN_BIN44]|nr:GUN4 domain-containing protein [Phormidesmis sp. CAN_BIN44]